MKKRQFYTIGAIFLFFSIAIGMEFVFTNEKNLDTYAQKIQTSLQKKEQEVAKLLQDTGFIHRQYNGIEKLNPDVQQSDLEKQKKLTLAPFNVCFYENDQLVFWTQNQIFLEPQHLKAYQSEKNISKLQKLSNGDYFFIKKTFDFRKDKNQYLIVLIPVRNNYALESEHLQNRFLADDRLIPKEIIFNQKPNKYEINSNDGTTIGWITSKGDFNDKTQLTWILIIYLMGFIALAILINDAAIKLGKEFRPWVGAAFLITTIFCIRYLTVYLKLSNNFSDLETFSETFSTPVLNSSSSLGDLLINIILLLWMMVFFHREFQVQKFQNVSKTIRYSLTSFNYFSIILGILMIAGVFKSLVLDSEIAFDFDNVLNLNFHSILAILGIILLIIALFLFSHRMMLTIKKIGLGTYPRLGSFLLALALSIPVVYFSDLKIPLLQFTFFTIIFIGAFDLFIDHQSPNLTWLVIWLVIFAASSSILLFKYNTDRDYKIRKDYAFELANLRDSLAEESFNKLHPKIDYDQSLRAFANQKTKVQSRKFTTLINHFFSEDKYLFHNYAFNINAYYAEDGKSAIIGAADSLEIYQTRYRKAKQTAHAGLKYLFEGGNYFLRTEIVGIHPIIIFLEFEHKASNPSKVYTELLLNQQYKDLRNLNQYDYAIYKDSILVEKKDGNYDQFLTDSLPEVGETIKNEHSSERSELLYHAKNNVVVKIGKNMGTYLKPISLFSYLFGLLIFTVIILSFLNAFTNALPEALHFSLSKTPSLRNRIQFAVIALILISFLIIGLVSVWHFQDSSKEYHVGRLGRKVKSIQADATHEIRQQYIMRGNDIDLEGLVEPLSEIHRLDVNVFDLNGNLINSSEGDIFRKGILAPKMGGYAFQNLSKIGKSLEIQEESIGNLNYQSAYIPLKNPEGKTLAYLGLPYYEQQRQLRSDVSGFMGALLNVYVFLLLIAGGIAIAVANSITKPISDLGDSLKRLKLGRNEPLYWESKDELGELIREYNRMIKKLEDSTDLLAQSEREGAWREMAKQVAHEIKNPLTPMKLSIQYMLHAYQSNPNNIKPLIERVSKTLIEQIDSLAQIANEFSNFAKMPKAENTQFLLNDLVVSVHNLFANERQDMDISLYLPDSAYFVYADKKHLTRVLNNLIKNAIQAIPSDRKGRIDVRLKQEEEKVIIKVSDNGVGISEEMRDKVFVPNFTTKSSGTGLGLAISKNIIEAVSGRIYFDTEVGLGTDFYVILPLIEVQEVTEV